MTEINGHDEAAEAEAEQGRRERAHKCAQTANAIASRTNGQINPGVLLLMTVGHDADTTALWNTLIRLGLCTLADRDAALNAAYDEILSKVQDAAPRIQIAGRA
jgi:D-Tyr-tRNAtyr deacylase